jgi:hypothetical protein
MPAHGATLYCIKVLLNYLAIFNDYAFMRKYVHDIIAPNSLAVVIYQIKSIALLWHLNCFINIKSMVRGNQYGTAHN